MRSMSHRLCWMIMLIRHIGILYVLISHGGMMIVIDFWHLSDSSLMCMLAPLYRRLSYRFVQCVVAVFPSQAKVLLRGRWHGR